MVFTSIAVVKQLIQKTHTKKGLPAFVPILDKVYETGRRVADDFKQKTTIVHDSFLPQWNYRARLFAIIEAKR